MKLSLLLLYMVLPTTASIVCQSFSCTEFDRGLAESSVKYMTADLSIECSGSNLKYVFIQTFAWLNIFIWPLGVPLFFGFLLFSFRKEIENRPDQLMPENLRVIEFLVSPFENKYWWFALLDCERRLSLTSLLLLFPDADVQILFALLFSMFSVVVYRETRPYYVEATDLLSYVCQWQIILCILALIFMNVKDQLSFDEATLSGLLIFTNLTIISVATYQQLCAGKVVEDQQEVVAEIEGVEAVKTDGNSSQCVFVVENPLPYQRGSGVAENTAEIELTGGEIDEMDRSNQEMG